MSASVARLRTLFRDQLLVRGPKGLVLTPRAEQLLDQLNQVMAVIEEMIALPAEFVAETSQRTFTVIGTDFVEFILLPSLMAALATEAPNLQVLFRTPYPGTLPPMTPTGDPHLSLGYLPDPPEPLTK